MAVSQFRFFANGAYCTDTAWPVPECHRNWLRNSYPMLTMFNQRSHKLLAGPIQSDSENITTPRYPKVSGPDSGVCRFRGNHQAERLSFPPFRLFYQKQPKQTEWKFVFWTFDCSKTFPRHTHMSEQFAQPPHSLSFVFQSPGLQK